MLDYRDIVDYVLLVFHKKSLSPISEEESLEIAQIVEKAQAGESVTAQAVSGNWRIPAVYLLRFPFFF